MLPDENKTFCNCNKRLKKADPASFSPIVTFQRIGLLVDPRAPRILQSE